MIVKVRAWASSNGCFSLFLTYFYTLQCFHWFIAKLNSSVTGSDLSSFLHFYSHWNLQTTPPSRASCGRSGWSRAFQSPAVYRRRCLPSASSFLMKTRTWSLKSTPIWQWTPVPVGKCFGLFHQPPSPKLIPNFCTGRKTEDVHFITLEELSTALRIVKSKVLFQKEFLPVRRRHHASVEIWTYEETLCLCLTRMFSCFYNLSS